MRSKNIRDLMVSLEMYPQVAKGASVYDALMALDKAQANLPTGRQKYRAVLIKDAGGTIIGKIGQLAFLKALEPRYHPEDDIGELEIAGVSEDHISTMMESMRLVMDDLANLKDRAEAVHVEKVMHPVTESIDVGNNLADAIHLLIKYQTISLLVKENNRVIGLLRLSDMLDEITREIKEETKN